MHLPGRAMGVPMTGASTAFRRIDAFGLSPILPMREPMRTAFSHLSCLAATALVAGVAAQPTIFRAPEQITDSATTYQLSRNPNGCLVMAPGRQLHLVYWSGGETTTVSSPSYVYYRGWNPLTGWSAQVSLADSFVGGTTYVGGRQPMAALTTDGTLWVTWHDHRNGTSGSPGNNNDNIEIYTDRLPVGGAWSTSDFRVTTSGAGTLGDNGFLPRIAAQADGSLVVAWYDFHYNVGVSEIMARRSDNTGFFEPSTAMNTMRLTDASTRGGTLSYTVPDLAVDTADTAHVVWSTGTGGAAPLYYAPLAEPIGLVTETQIASSTGGYFNPARLTAAPNGDLWVVYTNDPNGASDIVARRKPAGSGTFDAAITLAGGSPLTSAADLEVGGDGKLHLVWVDERDGRHVYYGRFSGAGSLEFEVKLTEDAGNWQRPTLALDSEDQPFVAMELDGVSTNDLWFTFPEEALGAEHWELWK